MKKKPGRRTRIVVRVLDRPDEFRELLEIQRRVWGHGETDLTPAHQFRITSRMGAILLGGYVDGRLVGFVYSFPAVFEGRLVQHSHLLAVLPEFRGWGVGKTLKWAQRDLAADLGYDLITWTFDPLQARNANLNLHALGAMSRVYWPNFYGEQAALVLGPGVRTDRLLAEWPIREARVTRRRREEARALTPRGMAVAVEGRAVDPGTDFARPGRPKLTLTEPRILAEVPRSVNDMRDKPETIASWQRALRGVFLRYFAEGYAADEFICGERSFYVLRRRPD